MEVIAFLQQLDHPVVYSLMRFFSFLGDEPFYFLLLPIVLWSWGGRRTMPLVIILLGSIYFNFVLKGLFGLQRPQGGVALIDTAGFGFPSGHAQHAVVLWGYFAWTIRKNFGAAIILMFFIGLSRIYLGVHFLSDVVGGWSIGLLWLVCGLAVMRRIQGKKTVAPVVPTVGLVFMFTLWMVLFHPAKQSMMVSGALFGLVSGAVLERRLVNYYPTASTERQVVRIVLGIISVVLLKVGLNVLISALPVYHYIQYAVLGMWISLVVPYLFVRTDVARVSPEASNIDLK